MKRTIYLITTVLGALHGCTLQNGDADAYGNFEAIEVMVSPETQGRIVRFSAEEGDLLQRGELIAVVDSTQPFLKKRELQAHAASLRSKIGTVDAQVSASRVQLDNLNREHDRVQRLYEGGAATSMQLDEIGGQVRLLEAQIGASLSQKTSLFAEMKALDVQMELAEEQLARCAVRSPVDGTLLNKFREEGEIAVPGQILCKVANLDELILRAYISGDQLGLVSLGQRVGVSIDVPGGTDSLEGTVEWISPQAEFTPKIIQTREERVSLVYAVKVMVKNDGRLKIGMPGELFFNQPAP